MTSPTLTPPPGRLIPVDPTTIPAVISLLDWRKYDPGDWPYVVPQILPVGLVLVYGRPGVAKTTLSDQLETCIAAGVEVAGWAPEPGELGRVLVVDYEGGPALAIKRSHRITAPFSLPTDAAGDPDDRIMVHTTWPGETFTERFGELEKYLREADHAGAPVRLARIDTLRAFLGAPPQGMNTAQYDSDCLQRLNRLAVELGVCVLVIHHPNKSGDVSGSVAIEGSCTAVYRIDRKPGEDEGRLVCVKNRVGPELSWPMLHDRELGTWFITETITYAQAANTGVKRAILDRLVAEGPAKGPEIRAGLAGVATAGSLKVAMSQLARDGWIGRDRDDVWSLCSAAAGAAARCAACGEPMTVAVPGQSTHPNCEPPRPLERPALPWGPGVPGDYWLDKRGGAGDQDQAAAAGLAEVVPGPWPSTTQPGPAGPVDVEPGELPGVEDQAAVCPVCGLLLLADSPHDSCDPAADTGGERWPAVRELQRSLEAVRPRPLKWVAPAGDPKGRGEGPGRQHRGMPQWEAAKRADRTVTGYSSRWRPAGLDQLDPARLVLTLDKSQAYVAACENVAVSPAPLEHYGPFDCDPRELGPPSPRKDGRPAGLAGVALVECPAWDHGELPHPLGPKSRPGEPVMVPSNMVELLWRLHQAGAIARPVVLDSWLGPRHTGLFKRFADAVKAARAAAVHNSPQDQAIKRGTSVALSQLRSEDRGAGIYRPDWHAAILAESMIRIWVRARDAVAAGELLAGMGAVDEVAYVMPPGWDWDRGWLPAGYQVGGKWGQVRPKPVQVKAARVDLAAAGIEGQRITPAEGHPGHVLISGPVPLEVWRHRA